MTMSETAKKRLVTRSDFDGLVCAMILKELNLIDDIKFVHPKDVQDGKVDITSNDITTNLPFDKRVGLAFDHHESELSRLAGVDYKDRYIIDPDARSAAGQGAGQEKSIPRCGMPLFFPVRTTVSRP